MSAYGDAVRTTEFMLDADWAFTNNGSVGITPSCVLQERRSVLELYEANPDFFVRSCLQKLWVDNLQTACDYIGLPCQSFAFVDNTTTGINDILKSFPFQSGDQILVTSLVYGAVQFTCESVAATHGLEVVTFPLSFPVPSTENLVQQFDNFLGRQKGRVRLAILEAIASCGAARLPLDLLIPVAKRHNVAVLIDGAHACGQLPNAEIRALCEIGDFFVSSLHKWMFIARSVGLLYVNAAYQPHIMPAITSWGYPLRSNFHSLFSSMGTKDYSPFFTVRKAIEFRRRMDDRADGGLFRYNTELVESAAKRLSLRLGTEQLQYCLNPEENTSFIAPFMRNVCLPEPMQHWLLTGQTVGYSELKEDTSKSNAEETFDIHAVRHRCHQLIVFVFEHFRVTSAFVDIGRTMCVRLSAQIYNTPSDYDRLGDAILSVKQLMIDGKFKI